LFTLKDRIRAQFIAEATNLFNHPNVTALNTTIAAKDKNGNPQLDLTGSAVTNPNYGTLPIPVPTSFPYSSSVLQSRILDFGLGIRW
jgi:hypothetical protein